ncbi:hypothetical protein B566_EDAN008005 [Ephemera danica]|nr:hypothetical protein B566_EDAN008005 [Ephemera danica]
MDAKESVHPENNLKHLRARQHFLVNQRAQKRAYFSKQRLHTTNEPSKHAPCNGMVHLLRPNSILFDDDVVRKLVTESCGVFQNLQQIKKEAKEKGQDPLPEILKISRRYRCIVRACVADLQEVAMDEKTSEEQREMCQNNSAIFYSIEVIFHLCEILCIDVGPGRILLPKLLDWMSFHYPINRQVESVYEARQQSPDTPTELHPEFWTTVKELIMRGRCPQAREMLGFHSQLRTSPVLISMRKLLHAMPYLEEEGGTSAIVDFTVRWTAWQKEVRTQLELGTFSHNRELQDIAELLAGNDRALQLIYQHSETWYQYLVTYLLFWDPTVQVFQLGDQALKCKRMFNATDDRALDRLLLALFESDILQVIKDLQEFAESGWSAVHLTDMLYHAGRLSTLGSHDHNVSDGLREDLILQYAGLLMTHHSLWNMGLTYFDHCPLQGRAHISLILPTLAYGSDTRILKVIHEAKKRNLRKVVLEICSVRGKQALRVGRLGSALTWAIRAKDVALCSTVADEILRAYSTTGGFSLTDVLDNMGTAMLVSERLSFVGKYRQFHLNLQAQRLKEASRILMDLATSGFAPPL